VGAVAKLKKKSELGLKEAPWSSRSNEISISFQFEILFGFFLGSKLRGL
jgi:hypothetical protein